MIAPVAQPTAARASMPPEIRNASASVQQEYRSALSFERVLIGQMTKAMQATVSPDGAGDGDEDSDGESQGSAATQAYTNMMPDQMADAMIANGGVGLAADLVRGLRTDRS